MQDDEHEQAPQHRFHTTHWSAVLQAGRSDSDASQAALDRLIRCYWYPLYAFARRRGATDHDAMDLTQGFFTHLLAGEGLASVSPEKGRFRSFLLAGFKNFAANQQRAATAIRRGGGVKTIPWTAENFGDRYNREPVDDVTPEELFDRRWVETLLQQVTDRLADDYRQAGKERLFTLLQPHLTCRGDIVPRTETARELGISTAAVTMSIYRMRRRYGELLRQEIAATLADVAEVEEELQELMRIISR